VIANGPVAAVPLADQPSRALPVPLITCPLPDPTYLGHALGVDRYLVKPISREQLLGLLASYGDTVQRVLIVDDDAQLAELMARIVRAAPRRYTVDVACGGTEGLARMQERRPDIVLLDLVMKDMDGLTLLQAMRAQERLRAVSVAIITAHDLPNEVARLPGRSITLQGPESFSVTEVLDCVQALLDVLPPPKPASSPPPRPRAGLPAPPVS
jgi:CheY-like chemotaxis protein